jgi:hypothetical protein
MDITRKNTRIPMKKVKSVGQKKDGVEQQMKKEMLKYTKKFGKIVRAEFIIGYSIGSV